MAGAPAADLARAAALEQVRWWMARAREFVLPPLGSASLLDAVGRLGDRGLAPWLANLPQLVRDDMDTLAWPYATGRRHLPPDAVEPWCVLVAGALPRPRWKGFVRQLGRYGMEAALDAALRRLMRELAADAGDALRDLRDVCLKQGTGRVALAAQQALVASAPDRVDERSLLVDMLGLLGREQEALAQIDEGLARVPGAPELLKRAAVAPSGLRNHAEHHGFFADTVHGDHRRRLFRAMQVPAAA